MSHVWHAYNVVRHCESFAFVCTTQVAEEVKDSRVIIFGKNQFREILTVYRWIGFVEFGIVLVEMVENDFSFAVLGIKVMGVRVGFQWFSQKTQDNTS